MTHNPNKKEKTETNKSSTRLQSNQISQYRNLVEELEHQMKTQLEKLRQNEEEYRNYIQIVGKSLSRKIADYEMFINH